MRVLLDESLPRQLARELREHDVTTVTQRGWSGTHNNLVEIGEACAALESGLEPMLRRAAPLTEYAWKFRCPGEPVVPSAEEAEDALATARQVYEALLARLPVEVRP